MNQKNSAIKAKTSISTHFKAEHTKNQLTTFSFLFLSLSFCKFNNDTDIPKQIYQNKYTKTDNDIQVLVYISVGMYSYLLKVIGLFLSKKLERKRP